jgi:hypothetical protein
MRTPRALTILVQRCRRGNRRGHPCRRANPPGSCLPTAGSRLRRSGNQLQACEVTDRRPSKQRARRTVGADTCDWAPVARKTRSAILCVSQRIAARRARSAAGASVADRAGGDAGYGQRQYGEEPNNSARRSAEGQGQKHAKADESANQNAPFHGCRFRERGWRSEAGRSWSRQTAWRRRVCEKRKCEKD